MELHAINEILVQKFVILKTEIANLVKFAFQKLRIYHKHVVKSIHVISLTNVQEILSVIQVKLSNMYYVKSMVQSSLSS